METSSKKLKDGTEERRASNAKEMIVPRSQADTFQRTLKSYADACAHSRKDVEALHADITKLSEKTKECCEDTLRDMRELLCDARAVQEGHKEQVEQFKEEIARVEQLSQRAGEYYRDTAEALNRIETKEQFICSFVDVVKQTERLTRRQYTRSVYAGAICKEVTVASLSTLEAVLKAVKHICEMKANVRRHDVPEACESSDSVSGCDIDDILFRTRYLMTDVDNMDRSAEIMDNVSLIDKSLQVATGEVVDMLLDCQDLTEKRRNMERTVRKDMSADRSKYRTAVEFDRAVMEETEQRMKATGTTGSIILSSVVSTLRRSGVATPGTLPENCVENEESEDPEMEIDDDDGCHETDS